LNINPSGEFITGDPQDDAGSTGRNIENGTYVSWGAQFISCKFGDSVTGVHCQPTALQRWCRVVNLSTMLPVGIHQLAALQRLSIVEN